MSSKSPPPHQPTRIIKEGWLEKKGSFIKSWKRRWFVLTPLSLSYYTDESKYDEKGIFPFVEKSTSKVEKLKATSSHNILFAVYSGKRTLELSSVTEVDREEWMQLLQEAFKPSLHDGLPKDPEKLHEYSVGDLKKICVVLQIDTSKFTEKKSFVKAISECYPANQFSQLRLRIMEIERESFLGNQSSIFMAEVNQFFEKLLENIGVDPDLFASLVTSTSTPQKVLYLRNCICALLPKEECLHFSVEDDKMLKILDTDRTIDSIRLLTLKYRVLNATESWLHSFAVAGGGVSVIVENMQNRLEKVPLRELDAAGLYHLMLCLKHIVKNEGLRVLFETKGALDTIVHSLDFTYYLLVKEVLEILSVCAHFGGKWASWHISLAFISLAQARNERPFEVLVKALRVLPVQFKRYILGFFNSLLLNEKDYERRLSTRNYLTAAGLSAALNESPDEGAGETKLSEADQGGGEQDQLKTLKHHSLRRMNCGGHVTEEAMTNTLAEDNLTLVCPERGLMAGFCATESSDCWYELSDGVLRWYDVDSDGKKNSQGERPMSEANEILGYSTQLFIQSQYKYCFTLICAGVEYHFGVHDAITRDQWLVALSESMEEAVANRFAYRMPKENLSDHSGGEVEGFNKEISIYLECDRLDRDVLYENCKNHESIVSVDVLTKYLSLHLNPSVDKTAFLKPFHKFAVQVMDNKFSTENFNISAANVEEVEKVENHRKSVIREASLKFSQNLKQMTISKLSEEIKVLRERNDDLEKQMSEGLAEDIKLLKDKNYELESQLSALSVRGGGGEVAGGLLNRGSEDKITQSVMKPGRSVANQKVSGPAGLFPEIKQVLNESSDMSQQQATEIVGSGGIISSSSDGGVSLNGTEKTSGEEKDHASLNALFGAKGGGGRGSGSSLKKDGIGGKGDALGAMFGGRGGGFKGASGAATEKASLKQKCAVSSSRPVPPPPLLPGMRAAGPPPLPGHMSVQAGSLKKPAIVPNTKMKGLFWAKMNPTQLNGTCWLNLEEPTLDWSALEKDFSDAKTDSSKPIRKASVAMKPKVVSLYDAKRTQGVSIAVGKLRRSVQEIADMCVQLDSNKINSDTLEILISLVPSKDEMKVIKEYDGEIEALDTPGKLFNVLLEIPRLLHRLQSVELTMKWRVEIQDVFERIMTWKESCNELRAVECENKIFSILAVILATGNYMNGSTVRGQAVGIKLDVVLKLDTIKRSEGRGTLLHFVADSVQKLQPDASKEFYDNWNYSWQADKISGKQLETDMNKLEDYIKTAKQELTECKRIVEDHYREPLQNILVSFIMEAEAEFSTVKASFMSILQNLKELRALYGDSDSTNDGLKQFFSKDNVDCDYQLFFKLMNRFGRSYKESLHELEEIRLDALRKEKKIKLEEEKKSKSNVFEKYKLEKEKSTNEILSVFKERSFAIRKATHGSDDDDSDTEANDNDWD